MVRDDLIRRLTERVARLELTVARQRLGTNLAGYPVGDTAPDDGDTLVWDGTEYVPEPIGVQFAATVGNGSDTTFTVAHNLGSFDIAVAVYRISDGETVLCGVDRPTADTVRLDFGVAPASNSYRVLCTG